MATTISDLKRWFDLANCDVTHMVIKMDWFDHEEYPVYVMQGQDVREVANKGERTMEIYAMHLPFEEQAAEYRSFHYEYPKD